MARETNRERDEAGRRGRIAAIAAVVGAAVLVAFLLFRSGGDAYTVGLRTINASQLIEGNEVQIGGTVVGSVDRIRLAGNGDALIEISVDDSHAPLPAGTRVAIRQASQSGIANRYVDLVLPARRAGEAAGETIPDGGAIGIDDTTTAVDLDQLFNTLDPPTRRALQGFFKGSAQQFEHVAADANRGFRFLNPALSTSSRLFNELTRDTPVLERFVIDSSRLVSAVAERRDDLAALVGNLEQAFGALGRQKAALSDSVALLPGFMRRANTTFVNLRAALTDVDPLVAASKPAAERLGPFLDEARAFAGGARPTVRQLSRAIRRPGAGNDLVELTKTFVPLASIALDEQQINGARRDGAFPEGARALRESAPIIGFGRPYTPELFGWFDDFSTTGAYDALGGYAHPWVSFEETLNGGPVKSQQYKRCPGAAEARAPDGSNVLSEAEQEQYDCEESARAVDP